MNNRYCGKLYSDYRLRPILYKKNNTEDDIIHNEIYMKKGRLSNNKITEDIQIPIDTINKDIVYNNGVYTLPFEVYSFIDVFEDRGLRDLKVLLSSNNNIEVINKFLASANKKGKGKLKLLLAYDNNCTGLLDDSTLFKYVKVLRDLYADVYCKYDFGYTNCALIRNLNDKGINYVVIARNEGAYSIKEVYLEYIYNNYDKYANVEVVGNEMVIYSLDGTYHYNMDMIYNEYNRKIIMSKDNSSGDMCDISILNTGELLSLHTTSEYVEIPNNIKEISKKSIVLNEKNKVLIVNGSDIKYNAPILDNWENSSLEKLIINCSPKLAIDLIEDLKSGCLHKFKEIVYNRDITTLELAYLLFYRVAERVKSFNFDISRIKDPSLRKFLDKTSYEVLKLYLYKRDKKFLNYLTKGVKCNMGTSLKNKIQYISGVVCVKLYPIINYRSLSELDKMIKGFINEIKDGADKK